MAPKDQKLELLRSIPLFARLGSNEILRLGQLTEVVDVAAGYALMRQGDRGAEMFIFATGRASVERDGRLIAERGPGEVVGEIALLSDVARTATVTATEPCRLFVIGRREFQSLMGELPSFRLQILDALAQRIQALEIDAPH
jgi:CRP/FNR family cyclic AMP-dependent transcriptional regulator